MVVVVVLVVMMMKDMAVKLFTACSLYCSSEESGHGEHINVWWWWLWWWWRWWLW